MSTLKSGDALKSHHDERMASHHTGNLGSFMNQGGQGEHMSANTLPELLAQGKSTKRSTDGMKTRGLKTLMEQ